MSLPTDNKPYIDETDPTRRVGTDIADASQPPAQRLKDSLASGNLECQHGGRTCVRSCSDKDDDATCAQRQEANTALTSDRMLDDGPDKNAPVDGKHIKLAAERIALMAGQLIQARGTWPSSDYITNAPQVQHADMEMEFTGLQIMSSNVHAKGNRVGTRAVQVLGPMSNEDVETVSRSA